MLKVVTAFLSGLSKKEKQVFYIAAIFVSLAFIGRVAVAPILGRAKEFNKKIVTQTSFTGKNLRVLEYKNKIHAEGKAYSEYFVKMDLTQDEFIADFLSEVETLAKASGGALVNINPVTVEENNEYQVFNITVEYAGTKRDLLDFVYSIEDSKKLIRVSAFDISVKNRDKYKVKCTLKVIKLIVAG